MALTVQKETTAAFETFLEAEISKLGMNPRLAEIPVKVRNFLYIISKETQNVYVTNYSCLIIGLKINIPEMFA